MVRVVWMCVWVAIRDAALQERDRVLQACQMPFARLNPPMVYVCVAQMMLLDAEEYIDINTSNQTSNRPTRHLEWEIGGGDTYKQHKHAAGLSSHDTRDSTGPFREAV